MIDHLIDKQDTFELVRDKIAQILADETASQQAFATTAGRDSNEWAFRVYRERSNPWEMFLDPDGDVSPVVNVWFDTENFDKSSSNIVERHKAEAAYNIDIYGHAISSSDGAGHKPGDREAALVAQRTLRLVRNILAAGPYTYLGMRGTVWHRWISSISTFQPQLDGQTVQKVLGVRLILIVAFNEFSPQLTPETLETVSAGIIQAEDGRVIAQTQYQYD